MDLVAVINGAHIDEEAKEVDRHCQSLDNSSAPAGAHLKDDGAKEDREAVQHTQTTELPNGKSPSFPVLRSGFDILLVKQLNSFRLANLKISEQHKSAAVFSVKTNPT